jgi:hypothetical protein
MRGLDPRVHHLRKSLSKMTDCRIQPGNDDFYEQSSCLLLRRQNRRVMRGLNPRIHQHSQESFEEDGLPGHARQ